MGVGYVALLNGMMNEAELHVLKQRMYPGKRNKARRGELFGTPPIGYVRSPDQPGDTPRLPGTATVLDILPHWNLSEQTCSYTVS